MTQNVRHILSLSGGKDSTALAIHIRDRVPEMEYIFHDTDKELPDTIEYLNRLEAYLGKPIVRTTADTSFDKLRNFVLPLVLRVYGGMLPSNHRRWCTRMLKLKPFEAYVGDDPVVNYVGLRADEDRTGYISRKPNIKVPDDQHGVYTFAIAPGVAQHPLLYLVTYVGKASRMTLRARFLSYFDERQNLKTVH
jgi:hypothetical protein